MTRPKKLFPARMPWILRLLVKPMEMRIMGV